MNKHHHKITQYALGSYGIGLVQRSCKKLDKNTKNTNQKGKN